MSKQCGNNAALIDRLKSISGLAWNHGATGLTESDIQIILAALSVDEDAIEAALKPIRKAVKPSEQAQRIRAQLSMEFASDNVPDYVWDLVDIAAQRGLEAKPWWEMAAGFMQEKETERRNSGLVGAADGFAWLAVELRRMGEGK